MLPIHVISLPTATLRRRHVEHQLQSKGYRFDYFDAVDGATLTDDTLPLINPARFRLNTGRDPSMSEIACFMSHRALWLLAAQSNQALIILEDDFQLKPSFRQIVSLARTTVENLGVIRLQAENRLCKYPVFGEEGCTYWRYTKVPFGACAYVVAPYAARKLLSASQVIEAPVDTFLKMPWKFGLPIHAITPYPVELSPLSHDSQITGRSLKVESSLFSIRRCVYRAYNWLNRLRFNYFHKAPTRAATWETTAKVSPARHDAA